MPKKYLHIKRALFYIFFLLSCCASSVAVAQPHPVVGTWDVTISGLVMGGGYLTFAEDNSITGYIMIRPNPPKNNTISDFNVGFFVIAGTWGVNSSDRLIGFFMGTPNSNCGPGDQVLTVNSFNGTVKVGKKTKLSMTAKADTLVMTLAGVAAVSVPDYLSGLWTARVLKDGSAFREFFSLAPSILGLPNLYDLDGDGANYSIKGCMLLLSSGNKVALQLQEGSAGPIRNLKGTLNHKKGTALLTGWDDNLKSVQMNIAPQ